MNCGEFLRHLGPYLDSECDPETTLALAGHLETCEVCAQRIAREKALEERLARQLASSAPGDDALWRRVERRFERRTLFRPASIAAAAVAACLALAAAVAVWPSRGPSDLVRVASADHVKTLHEPLPTGDGETGWAGVEDALRGRLPFSLSWKGPAPDGVVLAQARPCAFGKERVALLRCRYRDTDLSVAVLPVAALESFPGAAREFARRGDEFCCGDRGFRIGLVRSGGNLVCATGMLSGEELCRMAQTVAEGIDLRP
ncbi:MAG: zf-HC2 domain-containing protein [Planctomycetes bacterium]|nr:zf-HC2 domain-containing protein [Planctomycetota bacterium]